MKRAVRNGIVDYRVRSMRSYGLGRYKAVDDLPFGGGPGMLIRFDVLNSLLTNGHRGKLIFPSPRGAVLKQALVKKLSNEDSICLICGHYEGIDQRFIERYNLLEISLGDYILNGGELAAFVIIETISRLLPGFLGNERALEEESFETSLLEADQYTRPRKHENIGIPDILRSGDFKKIREWQKKNSLYRTWERRPDLFGKVDMTQADTQALLKEVELRHGKKGLDNERDVKKSRI